MARAPDPTERPTLQRVGPGGGHGRALLAIVIVGLLIGLAILKPWDESPPTSVVLPTPIAMQKAPPPIAQRAPSPSPSTRPRRVPAWPPDLVGVVTPRAEWGIRAIVASASADGSGPMLSELWHPVDPADRTEPVEIDPGEGVVLAFGFTSPLDRPVLDARVWSISHGGLTYVAAQRAVLPGQGVEAVFYPPIASRHGQAWQPGVYRLDALTGRGIVPVEIVIPGEVSVGRGGPRGAPRSDDFMFDALLDQAPGAWAISAADDSPQLTCLDGLDSRELDAAEAWLHLDRALERVTCKPGHVAGLPDFLALLLPPGQTLVDASLVALAPEHRAVKAFAAFTDRAVAFREMQGAAWIAGTYRIDALWRERGRRGSASGSWLLEVYPGPHADWPLLLEAARMAASSVVDRWALLAGPAELIGEQRPDSAPTDPAALGRHCAGGTAVAAPAFLAVGHRGRTPVGVRIERLFSDGPPSVVPAYIELDAVPGALLLAPVGERVWRPGYYAVRVSQPTGAGSVAAKTLVFCVGAYEPNGDLVVPRGVERREEF